jgi:Zn-dependent M28 family amino/carboxypeptidase
MRRRRPFPILALLAIVACSMVQDGRDEFVPGGRSPRAVSPDEVARRVIEARDMRSYIGYLASDQMRGRDTPSPELERAASWIAERFSAAGLEPAGQDGGFIQFWPYERSGLAKAEAAVRWSGRRGDGALSYGQDFAAYPGAGGGEGPLVYLGRAEDAPDSMNAAAGRVAVVLLGGSRPEAWRWPITVRRSMLTAGRAGARGVIFLLDPAFDPAAVARVAAQFEVPVADPADVPLLFIRREAARPLIAAAGGDLTALVTATNSGSRRPVRLEGARVQVAAPARKAAVQVPNVVALLPGSDATRAGQYVILTAHFDHVGVGTPTEDGDSIYNGADDNASGTAALLELAHAFGALPGRPDRPVLFLATSGEEKGLLGATWFASNSTVFLSDAVAVLNMDMVGRNSPDSVGIVGYGYTTLGPLVSRIAASTRHLGLAVDPDPAPGQNLFARSDHYPFARRGIPAIALTSGLHDEYHQPTDELRLIDPDKAARVARLVFLTAYDLAMGEDPEWTEEGRRAVR